MVSSLSPYNNLALNILIFLPITDRLNGIYQIKSTVTSLVEG